MEKLRLKEKMTCYGKRWLFPRGADLCEDSLPEYSFAEEDVTYNLNTTNNTIRTPQGYFRICFEHLPIEEYEHMLRKLYEQVPEEQRPQRGIGHFLKKGIRDWLLNGNRHHYQTYNVCSSMAEEAVAQQLGVEHLLTKSEFCKVQIGGGQFFCGAMSRDAGGVDVRELKDCFRDVFSPALAQDLTTLNLIDAICYEKDHRPGNYHIILDNSGKAVSICSFDNDSPWSFAPFGRANFKPYDGASEIIKNGAFNRPMLDPKVRERLMKLTKDDVYSALSRYIGNNQVNACWRRIKALQNAVIRTQFAYTEWSEEVMKDELSGKYGNTYYTVLYRLCELIEAGKY